MSPLGPYRTPVPLPRRLPAPPVEDPAPGGLLWREDREGNHFLFSLSQRRVASLSLLVMALALWDTYSTLGQKAALLLCLLTGYLGLCLLFNRVRLELDPFRLTVRHESLPGAAFLLSSFALGPSRPASKAQGLGDGCVFCATSLNILNFVATRQRPSRQPDDGLVRTSLSWTVALITKDGRSTSLDLRLLREGHARYLAQRLNRAIDALRE